MNIEQKIPKNGLRIWICDYRQSKGLFVLVNAPEDCYGLTTKHEPFPIGLCRFTGKICDVKPYIVFPLQPAEGELVSDEFIKAKIKEFGWLFPEPEESHVKTLDLVCQFREIAEAQYQHDRLTMVKLPSEEELAHKLEYIQFNTGINIDTPYKLAKELHRLLKEGK